MPPSGPVEPLHVGWDLLRVRKGQDLGRETRRALKDDKFLVDLE